MSILETTRKCVDEFGGWRNERQEPPSRHSIDNQLHRFKVWAGNIGVFAASTASADYRLKDHDDLRKVVLKLLLRLQRQISSRPGTASASSSNQGPRDISTRLGSSRSAISPASSSSSLQASGSDLSDYEPSSTRPRSRFDEQVGEVSESIDRLYRLSALIRRPLKFTDSEQVAKFSEKDQNARNESEDVVDFVRWHLDRRFPLQDGDPIDPSRTLLVDRLANAVGFRRRRFLYQKRHMRKLRGLAIARASAVAETNVVGGGTEQARAVAGPREQEPEDHQERGKGAHQARSQVLSATIASQILKQDRKSYVASNSSLTTRTAAFNRQQLDIPSFPDAIPDANETICPYCFIPLDKTHGEARNWRRHVFRDLCPYICLEPSCSDETLFDSVQQWYAHMQWEHNLVWSCGTPGHDEVFHASAHLATHLRLEHAGSFAESQLAVLLETSARPVANPFPVCPLCLADFAEEADEHQDEASAATLTNRERKARDHVALHLEELALFSLPERSDVQSSKRTERRASQASRASTIEAEMEDLPVLSFEDEETADAERIQLLELQAFEENATDSQGQYMDFTASDLWQQIDPPHYDVSRDRKLYPFMFRTMAYWLLKPELQVVTERPDWIAEDEFIAFMNAWRRGAHLLSLSNITINPAEVLAAYLPTCGRRAMDFEQTTHWAYLCIDHETFEDEDIIAILYQFAELEDRVVPMLIDAMKSAGYSLDGQREEMHLIRRSDDEQLATLSSLKQAAIMLRHSAIIIYSVSTPPILQLHRALGAWDDVGLKVLTMTKSRSRLIQSAHFPFMHVDARDFFIALPSNDHRNHLYCFLPGEDIDVVVLASYLKDFVDSTATIRPSRHPRDTSRYGYTVGAVTAPSREMLESLIRDSREWLKEQQSEEFQDSPYDYRESDVWTARKRAASAASAHSADIRVVNSPKRYRWSNR